MRFKFNFQAKLFVGDTSSGVRRVLISILICTVPGIGMFIMLPSALLGLIESNWTYQEFSSIVMSIARIKIAVEGTLNQVLVLIFFSFKF